MGANKNSPLKGKPLRLPGQSIAEERERLIQDSFEAPAMMALFFVVMAGIEWYRHFINMPPSPVAFTIAALVLVIFVAIRFFRIRPRLRQLRLALEGERAVGQYLERLRTQGFEVFHDVLGEGFNIDHVLIGPAGIFSVETKTWSKPERGSEIIFDGREIRAGGYTPDRDPIAQGKAQASWIRSLLQESTGKTPPVWPVIVFPGWFVRNSGQHREAWVLEPKALPSFLTNEPARVSSEDVKLFSFHLSRFIRASEDK